MRHRQNIFLSYIILTPNVEEAYEFVLISFDSNKCIPRKRRIIGGTVDLTHRLYTHDKNTVHYKQNRKLKTRIYDIYGFVYSKTSMSHGFCC